MVCVPRQITLTKQKKNQGINLFFNFKETWQIAHYKFCPFYFIFIYFYTTALIMSNQRLAKDFVFFARQIFSRSPSQPGRVERVRRITATDEAQFNAHFGITPYVCAYIWQALSAKILIPRHGCKMHLLWAFLFLKLYSTDTVLAALAGTTPVTFRRWSMAFVDATARLKPFVVSPFYFFL